MPFAFFVVLWVNFRFLAVFFENPPLEPKIVSELGYKRALSWHFDIFVTLLEWFFLEGFTQSGNRYWQLSV